MIAALNTGLRKTELLKLKFGQCNLSKKEKFFRLGGKDRLIPPGYLIVKRKGLHGGKFTLAPINSVVRTELEKIKSEREGVSDDHFIFISERTGVDLQVIKKGFRAACEAAGIPYGQNVPGGLTFHDLRRTFATRLRGANIHEFDIVELMGHSSIGMSKNYAQGQLHLMQEAVELLSDGKTPTPKRAKLRGQITPTLHQQRKTARASR